jgi:methylthioribose-1-phosphate isomerase
MVDALTSIKLSDDKIEIVNQLLLPHTTEWLTIASIEQAHDAIKSMKVSALCYALQKITVAERVPAVL